MESSASSSPDHGLDRAFHASLRDAEDCHVLAGHDAPDVAYARFSVGSSKTSHLAGPQGKHAYCCMFAGSLAMRVTNCS
jgi:hypothetical protein